MSICLIRATIALVAYLSLCLALVGCSHTTDTAVAPYGSTVATQPMSYQDIDREELDYLIRHSLRR